MKFSLNNMGRKKKLFPKDLLEKEYWDNYLSIRQIASKYKVSKDTINKLIALYGIPVRDPSFASVESKRKVAK